jgi:presenilin-like A22 family membrane protease
VSETAAPDLRRDIPPVLFMALLFVASIGLAMTFAGTFNELGLRAFEDTQSLANPLIYLGIVVLFTLGILLIAKYGRRILVKYVILGSVLLTIYYVAWPLLTKALGRSSGAVGVPEVLAGVLSLGLSAFLWFYPEWFVIDAVGVVVSAGAAGIFGISFGILPCLLLLVAFAAYDAIAVYRTKHMLALADSVLELRLPIMFVVPKHRGYSFLQETRRLKGGAAVTVVAQGPVPPAGSPRLDATAELAGDEIVLRVVPRDVPHPEQGTVWITLPDGKREKVGPVAGAPLEYRLGRDAAGDLVLEVERSDERGQTLALVKTSVTITAPEPQPREAMFMGLGDAVLPGVLVVSALTFLPGAAALGVALATLAGALAGFGALMYFVMKGNPHAGLPLLNGGAIVGFLAAALPLYGWRVLWPMA